MMTTLVDAAMQLPETRHLKVAIKTAEKRIEVLRQRRRRRECLKANRGVVATCIKCKDTLPWCQCVDEFGRHIIHDETLRVAPDYRWKPGNRVE